MASLSVLIALPAMAPVGRTAAIVVDAMLLFSPQSSSSPVSFFLTSVVCRVSPVVRQKLPIPIRRAVHCWCLMVGEKRSRVATHRRSCAAELAGPKQALAHGSTKFRRVHVSGCN